MGDEEQDAFQKLGGKMVSFLKKTKERIQEEGGIDAAAEKLKKEAARTALETASTVTKAAGSKTAKFVAKVAVDKATGVAGAVAEYGAKGLKRISERVELSEVPEGGAQTGAKIGALVGELVEKGYRLAREKLTQTAEKIQADAREVTLQERHPELLAIPKLYKEFGPANEMEMELEKSDIVYKITKKKEPLMSIEMQVKGMKTEQIPVVAGEKTLTEVVAETPVGISKVTFGIATKPVLCPVAAKTVVTKYVYDEELESALLADYQQMIQAVFDYCEGGLKKEVKCFKRKDTLQGKQSYTVEIIKDDSNFSVVFMPTTGGENFVTLDFKLNLPKEITPEQEVKKAPQPTEK